MPEKSLPFAVPDIGQLEIDAVVDVLRSGWLTTGQQCRRFEEEFAHAVGATHAVALNSCTAALHLSLEALDVTAGDLVFMSPYTFAATAEVVRYLGASPVFVDIDAATFNIDVAKLHAAIKTNMDGHSGRPRAIMPVHIAGVPCDMDEIWRLAREFDLAVVEDAAHAFPSSYRGRPIGATPDDIPGAACFSFYATKTLTTGEGGMLVTESAELAERARSMSLHGLSRQAWSRYTDGGGWAYDIIAPGFKYNLTDVAAAMGLVQLSRADEMRSRRAEIAAEYNAAFSTVTALQTPEDPDGIIHSWHLYMLRLTDATTRAEFVTALTANGIGTSVHFMPLHLHSYYVRQYGYTPQDYPIANREFERVVSLPIYSTMSDEDIGRVTESVRTAFANRAGIKEQ